MERGIQLSPKHGVNPATPRCYFCGEHKNEVILAGRLKGDQEAPRDAVWDMNPCDKCTEHMKRGVLLISVDPKRSPDRANPYRTGGWCVITDEAFERVFTGDIVDAVIKHRWTFIEDEVWDKVGLPRTEIGIAPAAGGDL